MSRRHISASDGGTKRKSRQVFSSSTPQDFHRMPQLPSLNLTIDQLKRTDAITRRRKRKRASLKKVSFASPESYVLETPRCNPPNAYDNMHTTRGEIARHRIHHPIYVCLPHNRGHTVVILLHQFDQSLCSYATRARAIERENCAFQRITENLRSNPPNPASKGEDRRPAESVASAAAAAENDHGILRHLCEGLTELARSMYACLWLDCEALEYEAAVMYAQEANSSASEESFMSDEDEAMDGGNDNNKRHSHDIHEYETSTDGDDDNVKEKENEGDKLVHFLNINV